MAPQSENGQLLEHDSGSSIKTLQLPCRIGLFIK